MTAVWLEDPQDLFHSSSRQCEQYLPLVPHGYGDRQWSCASSSEWTQAMQNS